MKAAFTFDEGWTVEVDVEGDTVHFPKGTFADGERMPLRGPDAFHLLRPDGRRVGTVHGELHLPDGYQLPAEPPPPSAPRPRADGDRRPLLAIAAALVVLVLIGAIVASRRSSSPDAGVATSVGSPPEKIPEGPSSTYDATFVITNDAGVRVQGAFSDRKKGTCEEFANTSANTSFVPPRVANAKTDDGSLVTVDLAGLNYPGPGREANLNPFGVGIDFSVTRDGAAIVTPMTEIITVFVTENGSGRATVRGRDHKATGRPINVLTLTWTCR